MPAQAGIHAARRDSTTAWTPAFAGVTKCNHHPSPFSIRASSAPSLTCAPSDALSSATIPSNGAARLCSIFIASSVTSFWPLVNRLALDHRHRDDLARHRRDDRAVAGRAGGAPAAPDGEGMAALGRSDQRSLARTAWSPCSATRTRRRGAPRSRGRATRVARHRIDVERPARPR